MAIEVVVSDDLGLARYSGYKHRADKHTIFHSGTIMGESEFSQSRLDDFVCNLEGYRGFSDPTSAKSSASR